MKQPLFPLVAALSTLVSLPGLAKCDDVPVHNPIKVEPQTSSLGLVLEEIATFPRSMTDPAFTDQRLNRVARINTVTEIPDGSGRLAVPDLNGNLYTFKPNETPIVYLDVATAFQPPFFSGRGLGQGFGYATFHPDFSRTGKFYTIHTEDAPIAGKAPDYQQAGRIVFHGVINEWTTTDPDAATFSGTHREMLRIGFAGQIHGIQEINFNPSAKPGDSDYGLLYVAVGEGGTGLRTTEPQNLSLPHGKLLRIDPLGTNSSNGKYGIPSDNPWVGQSGALGEIYAIGFRDPHRFSWDKVTGKMYLGHIGEKNIEAIYEIRPGTNGGWSEREGWWSFDRAPSIICNRLYPLPDNDTTFEYTYPLAAYDHNPPPGWNCNDDVGVAVAGGFVYRGAAIPELQGKYIFGDLVSGWIFYIDIIEAGTTQTSEPAMISRLHLFSSTGESVRMQQLSSPGALGPLERVDLRFGTDQAGELYILTKANAKIWKITGTKTFAAGSTGSTRVEDTSKPASWTPVIPSKWNFTCGQIILAEAGGPRPGPRRPFEYAILTAGPEFSSVTIDMQVRLDVPVNVTGRDVVILFGYQSDTQFYYAHLSSDHTALGHNGIFKVDNADRERIDYQWNRRSRGANPAVVDDQWHDVKLKHFPATGEIAVYVDGSADPLMTATDMTFQYGRVGFGSFDDVGRARNVNVTGTARIM